GGERRPLRSGLRPRRGRGRSAGAGARNGAAGTRHRRTLRHAGGIVQRRAAGDEAPLAASRRAQSRSARSCRSLDETETGRRSGLTSAEIRALVLAGMRGRTARQIRLWAIMIVAGAIAGLAYMPFIGDALSVEQGLRFAAQGALISLLLFGFEIFVAQGAASESLRRAPFAVVFCTKALISTCLRSEERRVGHGGRS